MATNTTPLFNFSLLPIKDVSPFGYENQLSLHWFGLTDGWYWLRVGDEELFRFSDAWIDKWQAAGETWNHPYVEYQVVRLWEDLLEILPSVLEPIPEAIRRRCDPDREGWQLLARDEAWPDQHDDWDTLVTATTWLWDRKIDAGYLVHPPRIRFWTDGVTLHITWDNRDCQEEGLPIWSTQQGQFTMPLAHFIDEVRSFDTRLIAAMAERVQAARADWPFPHVAIDLDGLEREHQDRATWLDQAFARARLQHTDWDAVIAAMDAIDENMGNTQER